MAKFEGSLFGKASGKLTGLVFGRARTRSGKVMTARELVIPLNPNTPSQQTQRSRFSSTLFIVTQFGPGIYRQDWDRSVGKLPGYQSLFSIFQNATQMVGSEAAITSTPGPVELGELHEPETVAVSGDTLDEYTLTWSTELGDNGQNNDIPVILAVGRAVFDDTPRQRAVLTLVGEDADGSITRQDGSAKIVLPQALSALSGVFLCLYFRPGSGSAIEEPSPAKFRQAATGSTVFSTDFSEYLTGQSPAGWSQFEDSATWEVVENAGFTGGKALRVISATNDICGLMLDELGEPTDFSILTKVRANFDTHVPNVLVWNPFGLAGKVGDDGNPHWVTAGFSHSGSGSYEKFMFWDGDDNDIVEAGGYQSGSPSFEKDVWFWIRMEGREGDARAKLWLDGDPEPATWGPWSNPSYFPTFPDGKLGFITTAGDGSGSIDFDVFQAFIP